MNYWLFLIPVVSGFLGWLIYKIAVIYFLKIYWLKKQITVSKSIGNWASNVFSFSDIEQKISDSSVLDQAMPSIENHIDIFLNEKLQQEIPMLSMFIGTKTTDKIKDIFINQLKQLFPEVMSQMVKKLKEDFNIGEKISEKLTDFETQKIIINKLADQLKILPLSGLIVGVIIGIVNLILICVI